MNKDSLPPAICIMGPTASGKTDIAVCLARQLPLDVISVDSGQVYRGMDIGTATPEAGVLAEVPHRLINIRDPSEPYSAAEFCTDALREMADITAAGRVPLLVGGTMMYFRALMLGLSEMPSADAGIRARLQAEAREQGWQVLHERLADIDPEAAGRIHPNDPQRICRALEVYELTGMPISELQTIKPQNPSPYEFIPVALMPTDRGWLHQRIAERFKNMLEQGFVDEVKNLYERNDLHEDLPAIRQVGYRQVWEHLQGKLSYKDMQERGIIATRQFARRQLTWLNSNLGSAGKSIEQTQALVFFPVPDTDIGPKVLKYLAEHPILGV
ncbi:MAG: tRNA (adenosine(37)-N6)-dimethylallyltransferase MiaA [Gammaproteobacteria bacterium]|nr:MAG: tRNA (adenosine(37)-N6)-dimethylallyltransferase MiaA [Gammaproteobacteria bacterium]